jgi:hypothetical protein
MAPLEPDDDDVPRTHILSGGAALMAARADPRPPHARSLGGVVESPSLASSQQAPTFGPPPSSFGSSGASPMSFSGSNPAPHSVHPSYGGQHPSSRPPAMQHFGMSGSLPSAQQGSAFPRAQAGPSSPPTAMLPNGLQQLHQQQQQPMAYPASNQQQGFGGQQPMNFGPPPQSQARPNLSPYPPAYGPSGFSPQPGPYGAPMSSGFQQQPLQSFGPQGFQGMQGAPMHQGQSPVGQTIAGGPMVGPGFNPNAPPLEMPPSVEGRPFKLYAAVAVAVVAVLVLVSYATYLLVVDNKGSALPQGPLDVQSALT